MRSSRKSKTQNYMDKGGKDVSMTKNWFHITNGLLRASHFDITWKPWLFLRPSGVLVLKSIFTFRFHPSGPRFHLRPNSGMLTILSPRSSDSGLYQCIAENPFGIASARPVNVKEAFLDNFEDKPAAQIKGLVGSSLVLNCEAPEGYPKPEIFWMIQSEKSLSLVNSSVAINTKNGSLVFANYQSENADLYSCVATNLFRNEFKLGDRKNVSTLQGKLSKNVSM